MPVPAHAAKTGRPSWTAGFLARVRLLRCGAGFGAGAIFEVRSSAFAHKFRLSFVRPEFFDRDGGIPAGVMAKAFE